MDNKKLIMTIMGMIGVISLALVLVVLANYPEIYRKKGSTFPKQKEVEVQVAADGRVLGTNLQSFLNQEDFFDDDKPGKKEPEITDVINEILGEMDFVESEELLSIDFLIHTADEINELEEDALAKDKVAGIDADATENEKLMTGNAVVLGIDVSGWNESIEWEKVKAQGIKFVIIRCGYRGYSSGWLVEDPCFRKHLEGAKAAGLEVGLYFFTQAINEEEAVEEAKTAISLLGNETIDYPIFIDTEGSGGNGRADGLDVETRTKVCQAFCDTIENYGYKAGIYASCNWFNNKLTFSRLNQYVIWLAEYRSTPQFSEYYDMWQYTSKGYVDGIAGRVDLDVSYLGY